MIFITADPEFRAYHDYEERLPTFVGRIETLSHYEDETVLDGHFLMAGDKTKPVYVKRSPIVKLIALKESKKLVFKNISDQEYFKWVLSNVIRDED